MTKYAGFARAGACAAVLISVCTVAGPAHGLDISPRYASPTGSGTDCLSDSPCSIVEAINNSPSDREVIIEPGVYGSPGSPITTTLSDSGSSDLDIHGLDGAPNPQVYSSASPQAILLTNGASLSHLNLVASSASQAFIEVGLADHVAVVATAASSVACGIDGDLSDSLCVDTGSQGTAAGLETSSDINASFDNDTLISTNGAGILGSSSGGHIFIAATDTIVRGTVADVVAIAEAGSTTEVDLSHSAYRPSESHAVGSGSTSIVDKGGNTSASPKFVGASHGDFREAAGSPTIDKGIQRISGTDLGGNSRTLGKTTDIGAYEFLSKPLVGKIHVSHKAAHSLSVKVGVNPGGLTTSVRLVARHGQAHKASHRVLAGNDRENSPIRLKVKGLKAGTKYHLAVKATNDGGTTSHAKSVKTNAKPQRKHRHS